ncbi:MAG: response regulator [Ignavibacteriaceae bacterium]
MKKILIIEDDYSVKSLIREIFEENNYKVFSASDGKEGIAIAKEILPDIIICDIMMPGTNGYEVKEALNKEESTVLIPFIFLTAKAEMNDLRSGMDLGADDYIVKPFRVTSLLKTVETRLTKLEDIRNSGRASKDENEAPEKHLTEGERLLVTVKNKTKFVKIGDIICITALGEYSTINLIDGSKIVLRKVLKEWENKLSTSTFLRIHRSTIINLNYVARIEKWYNRSYKIFMQNINQDFIISQRYAVKLKSRLSL